MFESAVVRQAWRLRDVEAPDVEQLRALLPGRPDRRAVGPTATRRADGSTAADGHEDRAGQPTTTTRGRGCSSPTRSRARPDGCACSARSRSRRASCSASSGFLLVNHLDNSLGEERAHAAQLVRIQTIRTSLVKADANATNAFLVGGLEPADARAGYVDGINTAAATLADASNADSGSAAKLAVGQQGAHDLHRPRRVGARQQPPGVPDRRRVPPPGVEVDPRRRAAAARALGQRRTEPRRLVGRHGGERARRRARCCCSWCSSACS